MRIERFEVDGFRSLRHLEIDFDTINVFYGPNGAGKSNVLAAIDRFWRVLQVVLASGLSTTQSYPIGTDIVGRDDFTYGTGDPRLRFQVVLEVASAPLAVDGWWTERVRVDVAVHLDSGTCTAYVNGLRAEGKAGRGEPWALDLGGGTPAKWAEEAWPGAPVLPLEVWSRSLRAALAPAWLLVPELRGLASSPSPEGMPEADTAASRVTHLALSGRVEEAIFVARNSPDLALEERLELLKTRLASPPLHRPEFRPALDGGRYVLQEIVQIRGKRHAIPLDLAGLGVRQLYAILGGIVLSGAHIVAIEEPEAHLHEPTIGVQLRDILLDLVHGTISQLFLTTHSTLFDLDRTGYFDVRLGADMSTVIERRSDLVNIDRAHAVETGAARHALMDALNEAEPDRVVHQRADGRPIRASEMIRLLVDKDPAAMEFVDAVTASAVRAVTLRASKAVSGG